MGHILCLQSMSKKEEKYFLPVLKIHFSKAQKTSVQWILRICDPLHQNWFKICFNNFPFTKSKGGRGVSELMEWSKGIENPFNYDQTELCSIHLAENGQTKVSSMESQIVDDRWKKWWMFGRSRKWKTKIK